MPTARKSIPKDELWKLYFDQKLSMDQVAQFFGCNHVTIVNRFKEFGWKSRGRLGLRPPIKITRKKLNCLYASRKLSVKSIAKTIGRSKGGVERKLKQFHIPTRRILNRIAVKYKNKTNFADTDSHKSYVIGFRLGDLNVKRTNQVVVVRCSTTILAQVELIRDLFINYGGISVSVAKRGTFEINCFLNRSFDFLIEKWRQIPKWIGENNDNFLAFLSGYIDAEGYVDVKRNGLQVQTQEKGVIFDSWKLLNKFGVSCNKPLLSRKAGYIDKRGIRNNKDCWRLSLYRRQEVQKFLHAYIGYVRHSDKRIAAEKIIRQIS